MDLRLFTLSDLFNTEGHIFIQCCRKHGDDATPGPHASLNGHDIPVDDRERILDIVNESHWRIGDADDAYCPFCVDGMSG